MKQNIISSASLVALVLTAMASVSVAHPGYNMATEVFNNPSTTFHDDPERPRFPNAFKRGFWDKRSGTAILPEGAEREVEVVDFPEQEDWGRQSRFPPLASMDKRGFGSMMPQYLVNMYRPDVLSNLPKSLFSRPRPSTDRGKRSYV